MAERGPAQTVGHTTRRIPPRDRLGRIILEARESVGLSQETAARWLGLPRSAIRNIESGTRKVGFLEMIRLSEIYQRDLSFFVEGVGKPGSAEQG